MKTAQQAIWVFLGVIAIMVGSLMLFIQSKTFASILKTAAQRYMPTDFGVSGSFSELSVKLIPPGVVIKNPSVVLKEKNPVGLPAGTKLDAQFIDVTFQFFQLLTGSITINAFAVHGANLKLDLDEKFFAERERLAQKNPTPSSKVASSFLSRFSWDQLVRFNFRSVSLIDSQVDIHISRDEGPLNLHVESFAKELTVGRATIEGRPSYDLAIDLQKALIEFNAFKHTMAQLQASVAITEDAVIIPNFGVQDGELNAHANGQLKGNVLKPKSLKADMSYIVRGPLPLWLDPSLAGHFVKIPKDTPVDGLITVDGRLTADVMDLGRTLQTKASVEIDNASLAGWRADKVSVKGEWRSPALAVESVDVEFAGGGQAHLGKTEYDPREKSKPVHLALSLENADFRKLLGPQIRAAYPLHMLLTGAVAVDVVPGKDLTFDGSTDLVVRDFSFDNQKPDVARPLMVLFAIPEFTLKSAFGLDANGFRFSQTDLAMRGSKLHAGGTVDSKNGFDIDVRGKVDLHDVGKMSAFDIGGKGDLHWTIKGKKPAVLFGFEADLTDAYYLNLNLGSVKGGILYNDGNDTLYFNDLSATVGRSRFLANGTIDLGKSDDANMTIEVPRATVQDFALVFDNFIKKAVPWYPSTLTGQMNGTIKVSGKTPLDKLSVEGDMEIFNADLEHEIVRYVKAHAGYRRGAYIAENVTIRKKSGVIRGGLSFSADDVLKFDFKSEGLSTLDFDHFAAFGIPYRAPISLETKGEGKLGSLASTLRLVFGEGVVKNYPTTRSELNVKTENGRIHGDMSVFGGQAKGKLDMGWARGSDSVLDVDARHLDFEPILIGLNPDLTDDRMLDAETSGSAHLKFQTGALSRLSGKVGVDSYSLRRNGYDIALAQPVAVDIVDGTYHFEKLTMTGGGTNFVVSGRVENGKIDYSAEGPINLGIFEFLVPQLASVHGSAKVSAGVYGLAEDPHFKAKVVADGLDIRINSIEQLFEDTRFKVDWNDGLLDVRDIGAKFANGTVSGDGTIRLYYDKVPDLDFHFDVTNSRVKVYPVAYARITGKAGVSGTELPYRVKGAFVVDEALINEDFNPAESARSLRSTKFMPQKSGANGEVQLFDLDVGLSADRGILVRNDLFDCEVRGNIKVINTLHAPRILGQASVLHGRLLFKDNFFTIQAGNLFFKNPSAIDPEFDLTGQTEVKGYKITLAANGSASNPTITFQSQPPLSQNDIVNLLTLGVTSSEYQNIGRENRDAYSRDELYGLLFSQSGVNKSLQQKLGVKLLVDQSQLNVPESAFRPKTGSDLTETVAPKVVLQKEVTKNLNASVGTTVGVGDNQERNVDLEYSMTKHWSVLGTYDDQRGSLPSQSRTSVGADLKYKLRF